MKSGDRFTDLESLQYRTGGPEIAAALRNLVIAWSSAESKLVGVLSVVEDISYNEAARQYYKTSSFGGREKLLRKKISGWNSDKYEKDTICALMEELNGLSKQRNNFVHGVWSENKITGR
jgi:hypothetical protein